VIRCLEKGIVRKGETLDNLKVGGRRDLPRNPKLNRWAKGIEATRIPPGKETNGKSEKEKIVRVKGGADQHDLGAQEKNRGDIRSLKTSAKCWNCLEGESGEPLPAGHFESGGGKHERDTAMAP